MTYHIRDIPRGQFGEHTKIEEEVEEFLDALEQGAKVMALVELADLVGAIQGYLGKHHPSISLRDLETMAAITGRAFRSGARLAKPPNQLD